MELFKQQKKLFGNNIDPACVYCQFGMPSSDEAMILCKKKGVVAPYFSCPKFVYMPTKRVPKRRPKMPNFSKDDFSL